jgi:hypothetical protein
MYRLMYYVSDGPLFTLVFNDNHDEIHIIKTFYLVFGLPKSVAADCKSAVIKGACSVRWSAELSRLTRWLATLLYFFLWSIDLGIFWLEI